jgi:hypothetical protein
VQGTSNRLLMTNALAAKLDSALSETSDVYVNAGVDEADYFESLRRNIKEHQCAPYLVSATVMPPGFPDIEPEAKISGYCLAKDEETGHWLVYSPKNDTFYCFWGDTENNLGAHGVLGSPLYCWSA